MAYLGNLLTNLYHIIRRYPQAALHRSGVVPIAADAAHTVLPVNTGTDCETYDNVLVWWTQTGAAAPTIDIQPLEQDIDAGPPQTWTTQPIIQGLPPDQLTIVRADEARLFIRVDAVAGTAGMTAWQIYVRPITVEGFSTVTETNSAAIIALLVQILASLQLIDNIINTDGTPETVQGAMVGGSDGVNYYHFFTNNLGELRVVQPTAANLNMTEVNSAAMLVALQLIDNIVNTDGAAESTQGAMTGGSDGTNYFHFFTNNAGELRVVQPTAANLNMTEVNSAAILTALQIIDNFVGTHDAVRAIQSALIGGRAHSGNPAPVSADDDQADVLTTLLGQLRVYMDSALNTVNDEVRAEDIPPPEIVAHGNTANSATQGNTTQLTATSVTLRRGVWIMVNPNQGVAMPGAGVRNILGASYTAANNTIISTAGAFPNLAGFSCRRTALVEGCINDVMFIPIDDPSKIYIASNTASLEALWVAI